MTTTPQDVIRQAVEGHVKGVALRMGLHINSIYKMLALPEACRYSRFVALFKAVEAENPAGANLIREDFIARTRAEAGGESLEGASEESELWLRGVAKAVKESSEAIQAALVSKDPQEIEKELAEAIDGYRRLMRMTVRRAA